MLGNFHACLPSDDFLTLKAHITNAVQQMIDFATSFLVFNKNIMPYLLFLKKQQNLKLSSAANYM